MSIRSVCLNCIDGRTQLPVIEWIKTNYNVENVDMITAPGIDGQLAQTDHEPTEILKNLKISVEINKTNPIFVVGHHDCKGNPVDDDTHKKDVFAAVQKLKKLYADNDIVGLWVNDQFQVELAS